jgi:hypothetical protein
VEVPVLPAQPVTGIALTIAILVQLDPTQLVELQAASHAPDALHALQILEFVQAA